MAPGLPEIATRYNISNPTIVALTLSIYLLAFVFSPFLVGPLSEIYGRNWVLHLSNLFFMVFVLASVFAPTAGALIGFRFLGTHFITLASPNSPTEFIQAGLGGCTPVVIGGGSVSDMFDSRERGTAMSVFTMGPLVGPILGPTIGKLSLLTSHIRNYSSPERRGGFPKHRCSMGVCSSYYHGRCGCSRWDPFS